MVHECRIEEIHEARSARGIAENRAALDYAKRRPQHAARRVQRAARRVQRRDRSAQDPERRA